MSATIITPVREKTDKAQPGKTSRSAGDIGSAPASSSPGGKAAQNERALRDLAALCDSLPGGARLPLHTDLMQRFGVSERAILRALDELQRSGRVIRRPGLGTIIAESGGAPAVDSGSRGATAPEAADSVLTGSVIAVTRVDHSYFDYCLDLLCAYAEDRNFTVLCKPLRSGEEPTPESLGTLATNCAGQRFVVFGNPLASLAKFLQDRGAQVVLVGTPPAGVTPEVPTVYGNQEYGGYLLTSHLIEVGHRHVAFIHYDRGLRDSLRWQGHQQALREAGRQGITVTESFLDDTLDIWEADPARAAEVLRSPGAPTAIMMWNDREAIRLLAVLRRAGLRVPEDVSVAGYDNLPAGLTAYPPMTTVDPGVRHQLRAAVDLLAMIDVPGGSKAAPLSTVIIPNLITRESTAAPPALSSYL